MKEDIFKKTEEPKVEVKATIETKTEEKKETKPEDPQEKILEKAIQETKKVEVSKSYVVIANRLNVRKGPSDKDEIIKTISSGTKVTVDTSAGRGAWSKITDPVEGYVMTKFIAPEK